MHTTLCTAGRERERRTLNLTNWTLRRTTINRDFFFSDVCPLQLLMQQAHNIKSWLQNLLPVVVL